MNILGIFILIFLGFRPGEASCPVITDGTCVVCTVSAGCTDIDCDSGWLDSDNNAANGCETSNSTLLDYCATSRPSNISNCDIRADFTVKTSSFYSLLGQTPKLCYCTSPSTLERYIIGENDKCYNGLPQYRDPNVLLNICAAGEHVVNNACVACPAGTTNVAGDDASSTNTTCDACSAGTEPNTGRTGCVACTGNTYSTTGQSCQTCGAGFEQNTGRSGCVACTGNKYSTNGQCKECNTCSSGKSETHACTNSSDTTCDATLCDTNQHVSSHACVACPAGTTNTANDDASGADTYCDITNGTCITRSDNVCTMAICDTGYYRSADNSTCVQCEPGYQCACDICDTREACPVGTFQPLAGQTSCDACSAGTSQASTGQTSCNNCTAGTSQASTGQTSCNDCTKGQYQDGTSGTGCKNCTAGQYQAQQGQADCVNAAVGHYVTGTAQTAQTACSPGTSQASTGQTSCNDCTAGRYQAQQGQADCVNTAVGHYVTGTAQTAQTACSPGTSQASTGQTSCNNCTAGTSQASTGQTSCNDCTAGKYQKQAGQDSCNVCVKGYCPTGATQQLSCPAGKMIDTGHTSCTQCIEGKFQSSPNQGACTDCEVRKSRILDGNGQPLILGYYQDEKGQARCKRCDGSVSANSAGLSFAKCAATCTFTAKPHICPFKLELKPQSLLPSTCAKEKCTDSECCRENQVRKAKVVTRATSMRTTLLAVFQTVEDADGRDATAKTTVQNAIRFETQGNESEADALERILGDVSDDISVKSIEKIDEEVYEMTQEELQQERAIEKRKSATEQRARKEQEAVDLSGFKYKELMKNAEDIQDSVEKEKALVEVTKAMAIVKETVAEQLKQLRTDTSSLAGEYGVIVKTEELKPRNPKLREKMEKGRLPFLKIKIPKDHTSVTSWADFDCSNADVNFDNIGIDDLEEVIIDTGEKAAACKNGKLVTYMETKQKNINGFDIFNVYCCQNTTRRRLGTGGKRILSSTGRECVPQTHAARIIDGQSIADDEWISGDEYECADSGTYKHPVMSLGATFDGCFVQELLNETGWVYDSPARTLGDCGSSQCTINNTNVTCLYSGNSCQPSCEAGYETDGTQLTCTGGDIYSTPEPTCTGCTQGKYSSAGDTSCTPCPTGEGSIALSEQCYDCPTGKYVASTAGCVVCPSGKYVAATGRLECHDVTDIATELRADQTGVDCSFGGTVQFDGDGKYSGGCKQQDGLTDVKVVMYGVVEVRNAANTACENQCAKWYGTLENGFKDPKDDDSNVAIYGGSAVYCQYLLWTSIPIKSDECQQ